MSSALSGPARRQEGSSESILWASAIAFAGAVVLALAYVVPSETTELYAWTAGLGLILGVFAWVCYRLHGGEFLAPGWIVVGLFGFFWVARGLYLTFEPDAAQLQVYRPVKDALALSQAVSLLALVSFMIGYFLLFPLRLARSLSAPRTMPFVGPACAFAVVSVYVVANIARWWAIQLGNYTKLSFTGRAEAPVPGIILDVSFLALIAYLAALALGFRGSRWLLIVALLLMTPIETAFAIGTGFKYHLVWVALAWLLAARAAGVRITVRQLLAGVAAFVFVATPIIQTNRHEQGRLTAGGQATTEIAWQALRDTPARLQEIGPLSFPSYGFVQLMNRTTSVESVALAVKAAPELEGFQYGRLYKEIVPAALAPRQLWQGKLDAHALDTDFTRDYAQAPFWRTSVIGPTVTGDLYINFGVAGVVGGWFLFALLLRVVWEWLMARGVGVAGILIYFAVMAHALRVETSVPAMMVEMIQAFGLAVAFVALLSVLSSRIGAGSRG